MSDVLFLTDTANNTRREVDRVPSWADVEYLWTDGSLGCDCQRAGKFFRAAKEREVFVPCGSSRYTLEVYNDTGELLYSETKGGTNGK
jgi:hypothetical protein